MTTRPSIANHLTVRLLKPETASARHRQLAGQTLLAKNKAVGRVN